MRKRIVILALLSFVICFIFAGDISLAQNKEVVRKTIRVGWYTAEGYQQENKLGEPSGYGYEYLQALSQFTEWNYELVEGTWQECLDRLEKGEIDILTYVQKTPEREETYDFSVYPMGDSEGELVISKDNNSIYYEDFSNWNNLTVGMIAGSAFNESFNEYCLENGFVTTNISYGSFKEVMEAVKSGAVDAAVVTNTLIVEDCKVIGHFSPIDQYIAVTKGNAQVLTELNNAMKEIHTYYPTLQKDLQSKYFSAANRAVLGFSVDEAQFILENPVIDVLYDPAWFPIERTNSEMKEAEGISIDILKRIGEISGLEFNFISSDTFEEAIQKFNNKEAPIFSAITKDYLWAGSHKMAITPPFLDLSFLTVSGAHVTELSRLAVTKAYYITKEMENSVDKKNLIYYDTQLECIEAVKRGDADYAIVNSYEVDYYLSMPRFNTLESRTLHLYTQSISIAVSKDYDPRLLSILTKSLLAVTDEEIQEIARVHLIVDHKHTFAELAYTNPVEIVVAFIALSIIITSLFILLYRNKVGKRENEQLIKATKAKSEFLAKMSHDMRTPMNSIIGFSKLAEDEILSTEKVKEYINNITIAGSFLLQLINDTLDMSKIEHGEIELHPSIFSHKEFIKNIRTMTLQMSLEKEIQFTILDDDLDILIYVDKIRYQQVFINLLSNAVKYTPEGGKVTFEMKNVQINEDVFSCDYIVQDTGIGMSPQYMKEVFEPFSQENTEYTTTLQGTGLGLAIVKNIIDIMGGTITIESKQKVGTKITVHLESPIGKNEESENIEKRIGKETLGGLHALVVEDHPMNVIIIKKLLEKQGIKVDSAENGEIAIDLFRKSKEGYYDFILMDIRMPVMNGLLATEELRKLERTDAKTIPIIATTANAFEEDIQASLQAGMNAHLAKPIQEVKLIEIIETMLDSK